MLKHLPNALTLLRLVLSPAIAWAIWQAYAEPFENWPWLAAVLFLVAAFTDLFDGLAARLLKAESKFGRVLDPIADKALVGLPLIAISIAALDHQWQFAPVVAISTGVIVLRDILITVLRLAAPDGEGVKVSRLAKWKTALELTVVGLWILLQVFSPLAAVEQVSYPVALTYYFGLGGYIWLGLLVIAALLSAWTAIQYLTARSRPAQTKPET